MSFCKVINAWCIYNWKGECLSDEIPRQPSKEKCFGEEVVFRQPADAERVLSAVDDKVVWEINDVWNNIEENAIPDDPQDPISVASCKQIKERIEYYKMFLKRRLKMEIIYPLPEEPSEEELREELQRIREERAGKGRQRRSKARKDRIEKARKVKKREVEEVW